MKNIISMLACCVMLLACTQALAAEPITVVLDCAPVEFTQEPVILNDRTLVPVRAIFEAMGASVDWNGETQTVTSVLGDTTVVMVVNNKVMTVNGAFKTLDAAPQLVEGSTMVPTRAVAESFGCTVEWNAQDRSVNIFSQAFLAKTAAAESFSSVKKLTQSGKTAVSAFNIPYFEGYDVKTDAPDGTDFEISTTTDAGHASLSVRSDLYTGEDARLTDEYVKSVADGIVTVVSGTLRSYGVVLLGGIEFMKIEYTAPRTVFGITDHEPDITVYMGRKNGVVYTVTYSIYGEVGRTAIGDFNYMLNALLIA